MSYQQKSLLSLLLLPSLLLVQGCTADTFSGGSPTDSQGKTELTVLVDHNENSLAIVEAAKTGFQESHPNIEISIESRPGGSEGDNLVKTRLATGDMNDLFFYNSGSLMVQIDPEKNLLALSNEPWTKDIDPTAKEALSYNGELYGVPSTAFAAGGILYNRQIYADLGLEVPRTWSDFVENCRTASNAGLIGLAGTLGDPWTAQIIMLADFHNTSMEDPNWATKFTSNEAHFSEMPGLRSFEKLEEIGQAEVMNPDFAATKYEEGLDLLANGAAAHYPQLTLAINALAELSDDVVNNIGYFPIPGDSEEQYGATVWSPTGFYIPNSTTGEKLEAAKKFVEYMTTQEGCDAIATVPLSGPFGISTCAMPEDVPVMVEDLSVFISEGNVTPALEFLSPVKGPALEQIAVEVTSGIRSAEDGARLYDEDVKKQAEQLNLPGW